MLPSVRLLVILVMAATLAPAAPCPMGAGAQGSEAHHETPSSDDDERSHQDHGRSHQDEGRSQHDDGSAYRGGGHAHDHDGPDACETLPGCGAVAAASPIAAFASDPDRATPPLRAAMEAARSITTGHDPPPPKPFL